MTIDEMKDLVLWCKAHKVKTVYIGGVSFEFSDLAFVEDLIEQPANKEMFLDSQKDILDTEEPNKKEEDDLLYWSTSR